MTSRAARSMAITFGLLLFLVAAVMVVNDSVALATEIQGPTQTIPLVGEGEGPADCQVGVLYEEEPDCGCPEGIDWTFLFEPGHEGDEEYFIGGVCGSLTTLTGDSVPSLTQDTSVSASAYSTSLPSTGLPMAVLFAGGMAATGAGLVFARRRGRG